MILKKHSLLAAFAGVALFGAACSKDEPPITPAPTHRLVGSWTIDSINQTQGGLGATFAPTNSDLTLTSERTGHLRWQGFVQGAPVADTVTITDWTTIGSTIIMFTRDSQNSIDTLAFVRRLDEQNRQRWVSDPDGFTLKLTRK